MTNLLPCPFCGCIALVTEVPMGLGNPRYRIGCTSCGATPTPAAVATAGIAIVRWNSRRVPTLAQAVPEPDDWQDDPSADERWNAGLDFGMIQLCAVLGVDPHMVTWDAATETLDGDVCAAIGNIFRTKYGDDFDPTSSLHSSTDRGIDLDVIGLHGKEPCPICDGRGTLSVDENVRERRKCWSCHGTGWVASAHSSTHEGGGK